MSDFIHRGFHDYVKGIKDNLELMKKYYPGFVMRLYLEMDENHAVEKSLCKLACENPNLDLCDVKNLPGPHILKDAHKVSPIRKIMPALWRFFTTLDSQVNFFAYHFWNIYNWRLIFIKTFL